MISSLTDLQRQQVVAEARAWVDAHTPYMPHQRLKDLGCDCATFILCIYEITGITPRIDPGNYSIQAHLHKPVNEEGLRQQKLYEEIILEYADEITESEALHGDLILWLTGHSWAHGGIILDWPTIAHSQIGLGVIYSDANLDAFLKGRKRRFFRRNFSKK